MLWVLSLKSLPRRRLRGVAMYAHCVWRAMEEIPWRKARVAPAKLGVPAGTGLDARKIKTQDDSTKLVSSLKPFGVITVKSQNCPRRQIDNRAEGGSGDGSRRISHQSQMMGIAGR